MYDILFYAPWSGPLFRDRGGDSAPPGGAETQIYLLAHALADRGLRVAVAVFDIPEGVRSSHEGVDLIVRPKYCAGGQLAGQLRELARIAATIVGVRSKVVVKRAAGIDVGIVALITRAVGRKFVFSSANVIDFDYSQLVTTHRDLALYRLGVRFAHTVVVQTNEQATLCRAGFSREPITIPSVCEQVVGTPKRQDAFLWIGRLVHYKHPLKFIELARSMATARFRMVGVPVPHAGAANLQEEIARASKEVPNLEVLGPMPRTQLLEVIARAVAVVNTCDFEGMPNVFLEGWARGVPALALAHDPGGVIERERIGAFAHGSTDRLRENAEEMWDGGCGREALSERCREYVRRYHSPEAVASAWIRALDMVPIAANSTSGRDELSTCVG
jgi:glycosyltransferase involved in cell wall biosynthesis